MTESAGRIDGCVAGNAIRLRVSGRAVALQCPAVREFVKRGLSNGAQEVRVELSACEYCDSTFVGTLLRIRKAIADASAEGPILVAPSPEAEAIVRRMGLLKLFVLDPVAPPDTGDWDHLREEKPGTTSWEFRENVVTAHRELADSSETMGEIYDSIAEQAERDLASTPRDDGE